MNSNPKFGRGFDLKQILNPLSLAEADRRDGSQMIEISLIDDFPDHPFSVRDDADMDELCRSISENGVLEPVILIVNPNDESRYFMVAGHRRRHAARRIGMERIPSFVRKDLSVDDAVVVMVDSNLQREKILPSEKAKAYRMRLEAITKKRKAGRPSKENGGPVDHNFDGQKSRDILAETVGDSARQIQRFIRLTELIPELLERVDNETVPFRAGVELSYLPQETQERLNALISSGEISILTLNAAERLKAAQGDKPTPLGQKEILKTVCPLRERKAPQKRKKEKDRGDAAAAEFLETLEALEAPIETNEIEADAPFVFTLTHESSPGDTPIQRIGAELMRGMNILIEYLDESHDPEKKQEWVEASATLSELLIKLAKL